MHTTTYMCVHMRTHTAILSHMFFEGEKKEKS